MFKEIKIIFLCMILFILQFACKDNVSDPQKLSIAVIPKGTTHMFWQSIHAGALKAKHEAMLKEVAKASYMNFYKDMQYEICLNNKITKGTWNFDKKTKLITTKQTGLEKEDKLHISELESDKIKLYFIEPGGDTITIRLIKKSD
jgi:uncharacterized membrane protein